jgi:hypothetical protein
MESKGVCPVCLLPLERIPVVGSRWDTLTGRLVLCSLGMLALVTSLSPALAQVGTPLEFATVPVQADETITQTQAPPPTLTLLDALKRAERNDTSCTRLPWAFC